MSQQGSFIPKSPINSNVATRRVRKIYVLTYLVYAFFLGTLIAAGATWFYTNSLKNDLAAKQAELEAIEGQFVQSDLERVSELESRLQIAQGLLDSRISMVKVLNAIEDTTASNVTMSDFVYGGSESGMLELQMVANVENFNDALFQRSLFVGNPVLAGASVIDIEYGAPAVETSDGTSVTNLNFTIQKRLDPETTSALAVTADSFNSTAARTFETATGTTSDPEGSDVTSNELVN